MLLCRPRPWGAPLQAPPPPLSGWEGGLTLLLHVRLRLGLCESVSRSLSLTLHSRLCISPVPRMSLRLSLCNSLPVYLGPYRVSVPSPRVSTASCG